MSNFFKASFVFCVVLFFGAAACDAPRPTAPRPSSTSTAPEPTAPGPSSTPTPAPTPALPPASKASLNSLTKSNTAFAVNLYHQLRASADNKDNIFISPFSISSALSMTYAGAKANTAAEMKKALSVELAPPVLHASYKKLNADLMATAKEVGHKLNIANGLCLVGGGIAAEFKALLSDYYSAEIFSGDVDKINAWVAKKTEGMIEKILQALSPNTVCVILNAIYFKGTWESQFKKEETYKLPFNLITGKQVKIPLMNQQNKFKMIEHETFKAITLPYEGKKTSMVVLLPNEVDGLAELEALLTPEGLQELFQDLDATRLRKIMLSIPKLKLETEYSLVSASRALGMKDAFLAEVADFSGMGYPKGALWISDIIHKAALEVNEEGAEAAAATAVIMVTRSMGPPPPEFRATHPFIFLIRDNETNSILFLGRIVDPSTK